MVERKLRQFGELWSVWGVHVYGGICKPWPDWVNARWQQFRVRGWREGRKGGGEEKAVAVW